MDLIVAQLSKYSGVKEVEYLKPSNRTSFYLFVTVLIPMYNKIIAFHDAIITAQLLKPTLARDLLGWYPKKPSMSEGMEVYWKTFQAFTS